MEGEITHLKNVSTGKIQDFRNVYYVKDNAKMQEKEICREKGTSENKLSKTKEDGIDLIPVIFCFNLDAFENEIKEARKITDFIVIVMDFIINNNLQIMNSSPFDHTYEKDGKKSSIDITLCSESISRCSNWGTDNDIRIIY
ncbi:hypothetical protein RFI_03665 [Reticulomyxa filosa]|uniref:Uncharacterized protein n=1 Tax=Reticulomyxa filosa TaxID=46433 RepID=X6P5Q2_RETFI|nr:hypothetical protein RFI_03665 [Reticulomyxa filosa]|eukprot:ETO33443.1 hypothetical protein RFI_03665 [Reticulomyxa filosa]